VIKRRRRRRRTRREKRVVDEETEMRVRHGRKTKWWEKRLK